jgi:hypothetical protein
MSVWLDKTGRHPDDVHRPPGRTTMRPKFWKFCWRSFLFESRVRTVMPCRPDGRTFAASNFHIEALRVRTGRMVVRMVDLMHARPDHADWHPDVWIWIAILALWMSTFGRESTSSRRLQQSSHICVLERNPEAWSNTEDRPDELLNRLDGCKLEQFEAFRHRGRSGRESISSGRMMLYSDGRPDGLTRRPDGWCIGQLGVRTEWHVVRTAGRGPKFLTCKLCRIFWRHFWIVESLIKKHLYKEVIFPTEYGQLQTNIFQGKCSFEPTAYKYRPLGLRIVRIRFWIP